MEAAAVAWDCKPCATEFTEGRVDRSTRGLTQAD
jgi:hypothetical protein